VAPFSPPSPKLLEAGLQFFTPRQAAITNAIAARIIPGDPQSPGAREAGSVFYIDRALAGYYAHLQTLYREGLNSVDRLSTELFGRGFLDLSEAQQDEALRIAQDLQHPKGSPSLAQFFAVVWEHTIQGTFGDPIYGGNHNAVGWTLLGFPGAQWGYTAEQMAHGFDASRINLVTVADLQRDRRNANN
jgi:gluconate 2-dehydrogenase gamma chain